MSQTEKPTDETSVAGVASAVAGFDGPDAPQHVKGWRSSRRSPRDLLEDYSLIGVLVVIFVVFASLLPAFRGSANIKDMVNSQAIILLLAIAGSIPLRAGEFDLSIASVMVTSAAIVVKITTGGGSLVLAVVLALLMGVVVGALHGYLIVILGVDSFVATLGTLTALEGLTYAITSSQVISPAPSAIESFARANFLSLPAATWYAWIAVVAAWFVYERAPLGRFMLFIGGNVNAARLAGINVTRIRFGTFVASALLSSFIGLILAGQLGAIDPSIAPQYLLPPFAAIYLGATTIKRGRFNAIGILIAVYVLIEGITGLELYGAQSWATDVFNGAALVIAVTLAKVLGRKGR